MAAPKRIKRHIFGFISHCSMKKLAPLLSLLAVLAVVSGLLISKMSFLARTAISIFKKKYYYYAFMKVWWKTALLQFGLWCLLLPLQWFLAKRLSKAKAILLHWSCIAVAALGLWFTYQDFRQDLSHRLAGERLHLGFYLFWIGWMIISLFLLWQDTRLITSKDKSPSST